MKKIIPLLLIVIFPVFLNLFPNYYAFINTPNNMVFLGQASWFDPWDINIYVSSIHSGQINGFLLPNLYTSMPNKPIFMYPLYTFFGLIFNNLDPFFIFHFAAILTGIILVLSIFYLSKYFLKTITERSLATLAICFGGGLGFLVYPNFQSADLTMTAFTFQSAFQRPHEAIGLISYLFSLVLFADLIIHQKKLTLKKYLFLICLLLIAFLFYPYYLLSFFVIFGIYLFLQNQGKINFSLYKDFIYLLIPGIFFVLFLSNQLSSNETFKGVQTQNLPTPDLFSLILGYGILIPLFLHQLFKVKKDKKITFLNIWFVASFLLAFIPLGFSRFYLRGLFFPLVILAIFALKKLAVHGCHSELSEESQKDPSVVSLSQDDIRRKANVSYLLLFITFVLILIPSQIKITVDRINEATKNNQWYYFSKHEYRGLEFLNNISNKNDAVLSSYQLGNIIPTFTHNTVYFGHLLQTPNSNEKLYYLSLFYQGRFSRKDANKFLKSNNISYIMFGKEEKEIGGNIQKSYPFLIPVFQTKNITIFKVK